MFRYLALTVLMVVMASATASAVSVRDIIALSRAGLSDEILVALIETDKTVFTLSTEQIVELKRAGVSDRVVIAMIQQGRKREQPLEASDPRTSSFDDPRMSDYQPAPVVQPAPPSTTVVVVPQVMPILYPYPVFIGDQRRVGRAVNCTPGRIIGRTEKLPNAVPGQWIANGRTGGFVFMSDPVCE